MSWVSTASPPTVGALADNGPAGAATCSGISAWLAKIFLWLLLALATTVLGCRVFSVGLATDDSARMSHSDAGGQGDGSPVDGLAGAAIDTNESGGEVGVPVELTPLIGDPLTVGCSDGTREGFRDRTNWPYIAGCAGGWQWRGLLDPSTRIPRCLRVAGNDSRNPGGLLADGTLCSAADLCAPTWHACLHGPDVASHSPTGGCEGIVSPGDEAFFVVMAGASPEGVCYPDPSAENDLHGCGSGSIGQPESSGCPPLNRRMSFADCAATGVWWCGTADQSLLEADVVYKPDSSLGGVLCCKDF